MEGEKRKHIIPDPEFDRLIPRPSGITETIKRNARLEDTIGFLPKAMNRVLWQVKKIIPFFEAETPEESCYKIWHRLYTRIPYVKDDEGKEQIRSPRTTWWERRADCDDFSVFVSAILCNMRIPHLFRIAMYKEENGYQHIYPVAIMPDGQEVVIDCVLNRFNKEVPYIEKIDKTMDLQFLDGVEDASLSNTIGNIDAQDLLEGDLGELGKRFRDTKFGKKLKEGLHKVNHFNPAAALLRSGILATMKINLFKVAGSLRYTYLSDEQAKQKNFNMDRFQKLKNVRDKLERIFYTAGGKLENLKKAILTGRGNHNHEVPLSGLGIIEANSYNENSTLRQLLGNELYGIEVEDVQGLGDLGVDPGTDAAIAAATSALAAVAAIIKSIGPLTKKGDSGSSDDGGASTPNPDTTNSNTDTSNATSDTSNARTPANKSTDTNTPTDGGANSKTGTPATATDTTTGTMDDNEQGSKELAKDAGQNDGFIKRAVNWAKDNKVAAAAITVTVLAALGFGGYKLATMRKVKKQEQAPSSTPALSSVPKKRKRKSIQGKHKIRIQKLR